MTILKFREVSDFSQEQKERAELEPESPDLNFRALSTTLPFRCRANQIVLWKFKGIIIISFHELTN